MNMRDIISLVETAESGELYHGTSLGAIRAHDNAVQYAHDVDPRDLEMLPWVAERNIDGEAGAVIVFERASFTPEKLRPVPAEWSDEEDEQEERLLTDADFLHDPLRHTKRIVIVDPQRYQSFKQYVLQYHRPYAATFAKIEQLA